MWRYVYIYPNTTIDLYPDQVGTWQLLPNGVGSTRDVSASYRPEGTSPRTRFVQWANQRLNTLVLDEDIDLVDNVQQGLQTRGYRCGPLSAREAGVAWFADRIRATWTPAMEASRGRLMASRRDGRDRILAAAVGQIAREGIDGVRIARIAMEAGVSTANVHYHFETREALLAEALEYSYAQAGDVRVESDLPEEASHAERLQSMIDQCLPTTPALQEDWVLWVELWLRAVRHPELRPVAEELYARMRAWFADEITAGIRDGEFERCDPEEVADRTLALLDGFGVRTLIGDATIPLQRARRSVSAALAAELGLGERLVSGHGAAAADADRASGGDGAADLRSTA